MLKRINPQKLFRTNLTKRHIVVEPIVATKFLFGTYAAIASGNFITATYNDGKIALLEHRERFGNVKNTISAKNDEWLAVKAGSKRRLWHNFWESVIFPYTMFANVMPQIVLKLNPNDPNPTFMQKLSPYIFIAFIVAVLAMFVMMGYMLFSPNTVKSVKKMWKDF